MYFNLAMNFALYVFLCTQNLVQHSSISNEQRQWNDKKVDKQEEREKDFIETMNVARGTESVVVRQQFSSLSRGVMPEIDTSISLQQITLSESEDNTAPVLTQLSHSLSEQLRLILNPTKASSLQGDFR